MILWRWIKACWKKLLNWRRGKMTQSEFNENMVPGYFHGQSERSLEDALIDASEKAKGYRKGTYRVVHIEVEVDDSIHDYKVLLGP